MSSTLARRSSWVVVGCGLGLYLAAVVALVLTHPWADLSVPAWLAWLASLAVYGVLVVSVVPSGPPLRAVAAALILSAIHVALAAATAAVTGVFVPSQVAPILFVGTLLVPFRDLISAVIRPDLRAQSMAYPRLPSDARAPFAPAPRPVDAPREKAMAPTPAPKPAAAPPARPRTTSAVGILAAPVRDSAPDLPMPRRRTESPVPALEKAPPEVRVSPTQRALDAMLSDPSAQTLRISFGRIAEQIPPEAFQAPANQVAAGLREPGFLLVSQQLVLAQIADGIVRAGWETVAEQFPRHLLAMSDEEITRALPDGQIVLPLEEIFPQLPRVLFQPGEASVDIEGIESYPAPFRPAAGSEPPPTVVESPKPRRTEAATIKPEPTRAPEVAPDLARNAVALDPDRVQAAVASKPTVTETVDGGPVAAAVRPVTTPEPPIAEIDPAPESALGRTATSLEATPDAAGTAAPEPALVPTAGPPEPSDIEMAAPAPDRALILADARPEPADVELAVPTSDSVLVPSDARPESTDAEMTVPAWAPGIAAPPESLIAEIGPAPTVAEMPQAIEPALGWATAAEPAEAEAAERDPGRAGARGSEFGGGVRRPEPSSAAPVMESESAPPLDVVSQPRAALPPSGVVESLLDRVDGPARDRVGGTALPPSESFPDWLLEDEPEDAQGDTQEDFLELLGDDEEPELPLAERARLTPINGLGPAPAPLADALAGVESREVERGRRATLREIAARLTALGPIELGASVVDGVSVYSAFTSGTATDELVDAAVQMLPLLDRPYVPAASQLTLRGADVALVVTPIGRDAGACLVTGVAPGSRLALAELLSLRAASALREQSAARPGAAPLRAAVAEPELLDTEAPTRVRQAALALSAFGSVTASALRDADGSGALYLFLPTTSDAHAVAAHASEIRAALGLAAARGVAFHTAVLRSGERRLIVRLDDAPAGGQRVVVAGGETACPGLAHRQVDRVAALLGGR